MRLLSDEGLLKIPVKDNGEKLIYIKDICPNVILKPGKYITREGKKVTRQAFFVRTGVAKKLNLAKSYLPEDYDFVIRCIYRPLRIQKKSMG